jgi:hypothetical protein
MIKNKLKYFAQPLEDDHGTLWFCGTPVEKHCCRCFETSFTSTQNTEKLKHGFLRI